MARVVIHARFDQPMRENPWTELVGVDAAAHPYHDWYERLTAECYRPFGFSRILVDGAAVAVIVNLYERCSFDLAPVLAAWMARNQPGLYERILAADAHGQRAVARSWSSPSLASLNERDRHTEIAWGITDFRARFGRAPGAFFLPATDVVTPVLEALGRHGISLVLTDAVVDDTSSPLRQSAEVPGMRVVYAHRTPTERLARAFRSAPVDQVADELSQLAHGVGVTVAVVDGHVFGHHVAYAERSLAVLAGQQLPRLGLRPGSVADAAPDAVATEAPPSGTLAADPWRTELQAAVDAVAGYTAELTETAGRAHLRDPWTARDHYVEVVAEGRAPVGFLAEHATDGADAAWALGLLEAHRGALAATTGLWWAGDVDDDAAVGALRCLARAIDVLIELGATPPVAEVLDRLQRATSPEEPGRTARQVWDQEVLAARVDPLRTAAHLALIRHLRSGAPTRVGVFDVKSDRHARSRRGDLQLDTGRVRCTNRRTTRSVELAYAVLGDTNFDLVGAVRPAGTVLDDDTDAVALHKALAGPMSHDALRTEVIERFGPLEFGFDALIPEAAPRVLGDIAQGALGGLVHRAIVTGSAADASAVPRFVRLARTSGIRLDIAPAQEALYQALLSGQGAAPLVQLGADLGLAVGRLSAPE